jgi:transcriptional regulator of met regulon
VQLYGLRYLSSSHDHCGVLSVATVISSLVSIPLLFLSVISMQVSERMDTSLLREAVLSMLLASALLSGWTALCLGVDHLRRPGNHL